jgi:IS5 family transposase
MFTCPATDDFFRARLDHMIDLRLPLVLLASHMPWQALEARVSQTGCYWNSIREL